MNSNSHTDRVKTLGIIAGRGSYPLMMAEAARQRGVERIMAVAFRGETDRRIANVVDHVVWAHVGQLQRMLDALQEHEATHAVLAGQLAPRNLFHLVYVDGLARGILRQLRHRNAHTIFGAVVEQIEKTGVEVLPANAFMEDLMPAAGLLTARAPSEQEGADIELGLKVAKTSGDLDIGQTVVIKEGTVLAVEAFEGTDQAIRRGGKLAGGPGAVVVKVAKSGHDMRFDIPVIGLRTLKSLRKAKASALAIEAGRVILLDGDQLMEQANRQNLAIVAV